MTIQSMLFNAISKTIQKPAVTKKPVKQLQLTLNNGLDKRTIEQEAIFWQRVLLNEHFKDNKHFSVSKICKIVANEIRIKQGSLPSHLAGRDSLTTKEDLK